MTLLPYTLAHARSFCGFDHGVGHPLLLLYNAKAPNCRKNKALNGLGHYSEWPKVADAVIKAASALRKTRNQSMMKALHHPKGNQQAFLRGLAHLYNLVPYQRRAQHAGQCGVEIEGGTVPTRDWLRNLQILTSGGFR